MLRAAPGADTIAIDGVLSESAWAAAEAGDAFAQTEPREGTEPSVRTTVRVLVGQSVLVIGIQCEDDPARIVSFSVSRDAAMQAEDHVRIVLGPFLDGQSGYVFAVNPRGARYDSLITSGGDSENIEWDGIWEAATSTSSNGWSVEVRVPIRTLTFKPGLQQWHFNVERRVQRLLETDRWAFATRQYRIRQTSRAGLLSELPEFAIGRGLDIRPSITAGGGIPAPSAAMDSKFRPSVDVTQRLGSNVAASVTVNTDFAEADVDTRRTNLTRFPLLFPEKRAFFLEGSDIFQFGPTVNRDVIPYFSRRIGLVEGVEVPLIAGAKINGRIADTNFGGLVIGAGDKSGVVDQRTRMAVARVKQNLWRESYIGALVTAGDPLGRPGSWLAGADFTYQTTRFVGDKNLTASVWGLATGRDGLRGDTASYAFKVDYPNDKWDARVWYKRIGRDFDPRWDSFPTRSTDLEPVSDEPAAVCPRSHPANELRRESLHMDRPVRPVGNLRCPTPDRRFPVSHRRSGSGAGESIRRPAARPVRDLAGNRHRARSLPMGATHGRRVDRAKTALLLVIELDLRRLLQRGARPVRMELGVESSAAFTVEFDGERNIGRLTAGRFQANARRHARADERLGRFVDIDLRPVRHGHRLGRH